MTGSLVNIVVNYSQSLCLGVAATVEVHFNENSNELLKGYRAATYIALGLGRFAILVTSIYMVENLWDINRSKDFSDIETANN